MFFRNSFVNTVSKALGIPSWRLAYVRESKGKEKNCMTATFAIVGSGKWKCLPLLVVDTQSVKTTILGGQYMQMCKLFKCKQKEICQLQSIGIEFLKQ